MKSDVIRDGNGKVLAKIVCPRCGIESDEFVPDSGKGYVRKPLIRRTCDRCLEARMGPAMRAFWRRIHPE